MAYPTTAVAVGEMITAAHMNAWPVRIADTTLGTDAASIEFSSIPQHYAHLVLVVYARTDQVAFSSFGALRLNSYAGASDYDYQFVYGVAAVVTSGENIANSWTYVGPWPANSAAANLFSATVIRIPHYAQATNQKTVLARNSAKIGTASGNLSAFRSGGWLRNTEAVSTITLLSSSGNLRAGSRATLFGWP